MMHDNMISKICKNLLSVCIYIFLQGRKEPGEGEPPPHFFLNLLYCIIENNWTQAFFAEFVYLLPPPPF